MPEPWEFLSGWGKTGAKMSEWLGACASFSPHQQWGVSALFLGVTRASPCWGRGCGRRRLPAVPVWQPLLGKGRKNPYPFLKGFGGLK